MPDSLIIAVAQYLPFLICVVGALTWLFLPRKDKAGLAVQSLVALVMVVLLIKMAAAIHTDPRPFVVDPSVKPMFAHVNDNGFPSDHTALASTVALLVMSYRSWIGAILLAASLLVGAARMAAHVHHGQDIIAGVVIAVLAVSIATIFWRWVRSRLPVRLDRMISG